MKKFISTLLVLTMSLTLFSGMVYGETNTIPVLETDRVYEAEAALWDAAELESVVDKNASEGYALNTYSGAKDPGTAVAVDDAMIAFKVTVPQDIMGAKFRVKHTFGTLGTTGTVYGGFLYDIPNDNISVWTKEDGKVSTQGEYVWWECSVNLKKGENIFMLANRKYNVRIDQIEVVAGIGVDYAEPSVTSGTVTYPQSMEGNRIGTVPKFEDGDNVLFIGDSITHFATTSGKYHNNLFSYYATRYPDKKYSYLNKGIGGNVTGEVLNRMNYDIFNTYDEKANKAVVLIGTNDLTMSNYYDTKPQTVGDISINEHNFVKYENGLRQIITELKERGIEEIILVTPPLYDEWSTGITTTSIANGFNNAVRRGATIQNKIAEEIEGVYFVDINTPMYIIDDYNKGVKGSSFNLFGSSTDRVHPSEVASWIMTYAILKAQGEDGEVATVKIDASKNSVQTSNATVSNLTIAEDSVNYKYAPKAIPLAADSVYREAEKLFPITEELNREIIQVNGLEDGIYDIKIDGATVMRASKEQLEKGVNIADKENNPGQQKALKAQGLISARASSEKGYRDYQLNIENNVSTFKLDTTSNETMLSSLQTYVTANPTKTTAVSLLEQMKKEEETVDALQALSNAAYEYCQPGTYTVTIEKSADTSAVSEVEVKYVDHQLPDYARFVKEQTSAPGISVDRLTFTDESGNELSSIPESGTVNVSGTLTNNTTKKINSILWSGAFNNSMLSNGTLGSDIEIEAGKSAEISGTIQLGGGANVLKAGLWESKDSLKPYLSSAVYPSSESGIEKVYVNNNELSFHENVTSYDYYIASDETITPYVSVVPKNLNANIEVTQGLDKATIKAGDKTYTINFKNVETAHLAGIKVSGEAIENFSKEDYYYELPKTKLGEVTAVAPDGVTATVVQASAANSNTATITTENTLGDTRTYWVKFATRDVGVIENVKVKGAPSTAVKGIPSRGGKPENFYDPYLTPDQMLTNLAANSNLDNDDYRLSNDTYRKLSTMWTTPQTNAYGYNLTFTVADVGGTMFVNENVTRLYKSEVDFSSQKDTCDPTKVYEFTLSKPGTVYISTAGASTYIAGLNKGWTYEYNPAKYAVPTPSYVEFDYLDGVKLFVPDGGVIINTNSPTSGHVYYKHFNANETVEIPSFSATSSNKQLVIFVVWDEVE